MLWNYSISKMNSVITFWEYVYLKWNYSELKSTTPLDFQGSYVIRSYGWKTPWGLLENLENFEKYWWPRRWKRISLSSARKTKQRKCVLSGFCPKLGSFYRHISFVTLWRMQDYFFFLSCCADFFKLALMMYLSLFGTEERLHF